MGFCLFIGVSGQEGDVSASCRGRDRLGGLLGAEGFTAETSVFIGVSSLPRGGGGNLAWSPVFFRGDRAS